MQGHRQSIRQVRTALAASGLWLLVRHLARRKFFIADALPELPETRCRSPGFERGVKARRALRGDPPNHELFEEEDELPALLHLPQHYRLRAALTLHRPGSAPVPAENA